MKSTLRRWGTILVSLFSAVAAAQQLVNARTGYDGPAYFIQNAATGGFNADATAVTGYCDGGYTFGCLTGISSTGYGVMGISATSDAGWSGLYGSGVSGPGALTKSIYQNGTTGISLAGGASGVYGENQNSGYGVAGRSNSNGTAIYGDNTCTGTLCSGYAGYFTGRVYIPELNVQYTLTKPMGSFKIDHPLDPANKYLYHSFVESPDMMNIYNGVVKLDKHGEATVSMPNWFEALNQDFRYQLTCIGGFAPVFIAQEMQGNHFKISGGEAGMKVSWQVTGVRHDAFANAHRIQVEVDKKGEEAGRYLHPLEQGMPESMGMPVPKGPAGSMVEHPAR